MKVSTELADVLKRASEAVNSWEPWQRSRDPQGAKDEDSRIKTSDTKCLSSSSLDKLTT